MFDDRVTSLGELQQSELLMTRTFLEGASWQEQFEEWGDGEELAPPDWLVEWSAHWRHDPILKVEGDDWWRCEIRLVFDDASHEVWLVVYQGVGGDEGITVRRIACEGMMPNAREVWGLVLEELESLGDSPFRGALVLSSTRWLPREQFADYLTGSLTKHGLRAVGGLSVEEWLLREYDGAEGGEPSKAGRDS